MEETEQTIKVEQEPISLRDEIKDLKREIIDGSKDSKRNKKKKAFRLPFRARVNKSNLRKGYLTIIVLHENMGIEFIKEPIIDGTIKLHDTYHALEEFDIFHYKGKPMIIQPKSKLNPHNPFRPKENNPLNGPHETYGQKYVMARMEGDKIVSRRKMGLGLSIGALLIGAVIVYALITGGG